MTLRVLCGLILMSCLQTQEGLGSSVSAQEVSTRTQENRPTASRGELRSGRVVLARDPDDLRPRRIPLRPGTELKVRLNETLSTRHNVRGDSFSTEVVEAVLRDGRMVLPVGTPLRGRIISVRRAGRISGRAEMRMHFGELELHPGQNMSIEASLRGVQGPQRAQTGREGQIEGESTKGRDTAKVGTAAGIGALIGVIAGGKKGAAIGAGAGGMAGLAGILASRGRDVILDRGSELTLVLEKAVFIVVPAVP